MTIIFVIFTVVALSLTTVNAEQSMVRQCRCDEVEGCKNTQVSNLIPCADHCQKYATNLGANYEKLKQCILRHEPQLKEAAECTEAEHKDSCARDKPDLLPKRYPETLKITAISEIRRMLMRSGVSEEVRGILSQGKKMFECVHTCMDRRSDECANKLGCQLKLPLDTVLVENAKRCVVKSGIGNKQVHEICKCAVEAGLKHLNTGICNKLTIS